METKKVSKMVTKMMKSAIAFSLAFVMVIAGIAAFGGKEVSAATNLTTGISAYKNADGTITAKFMAMGDMETFDLGLVYDNTKVRVVDEGFDSNFLSKYSQGIKMSYDFGNYVVFGGAYGATINYLGYVGYVTFSVLGSDPGSVMLVQDSASYNHDFTNAQNVSSTKVFNLNNAVAQ